MKSPIIATSFLLLVFTSAPLWADVVEAGGQSFATAQVISGDCLVIDGVSGDAAPIGAGTVTTTGGNIQFFTLSGGTPNNLFTLIATPIGEFGGDGTARQYSDGTFTTEIFFDDDSGPGNYPMFDVGLVITDGAGEVHLGLGEFGDDDEITYGFDVLDVSSFTSFDDFFRVEGLTPGTTITGNVISDGATFGFFDSFLTAFDSSETILGISDDNSTGPNPYFSTLSVTVPADGVVVFQVATFGERVGGTYQFETTTSPPPPPADEVSEAGGQTFATAQLLPTPDVNDILVIDGVSGDATLIASGTQTTTGGDRQFFTVGGATPNNLFTLAATPAVFGQIDDATARQYDDAAFTNEIFFDDDDGPGFYPEFRSGEVISDANGDLHLSIGEFGDDEEITVGYDLLDVSSATSSDDYFRIEGLQPGSDFIAEILSDGATFGFFDAVLLIFDSAETELGAVDDGSGPNFYFGPPLTVTVPADGVVVILVESFDDSPGGTYNLRISGTAVSGGGFIPPASYTVFRGMEISGQLSDFVDSDDVRARYNPGFVINSDEAPVWLIFDAIAVTAVDFQVESQAGTPGLTYTVEAWNWVTKSYDVLGTQGEGFNADAVSNFPLTSADQIDAGGEVRSRVGWRKTGLTINFPWETRVDQTGWNQ